MFYKFIVFMGFFFITSSFGNILKNLTTFEGNFVQTIKNSSNNNIKYKGKVFIKNNGKVLWEYKQPVIKNIYINKNFVIIDEPELEQAIFTPLNKEINIIKLLESAKKVTSNIYKTKIQNIDYKVVLKNNKIFQISYMDELENNILISFSNVKQNVKIDDDIFNFTIPKFYDIIRK